MNIKSAVAGVAITVLALSGPAAWSKTCSGKGWHMVSKSCPIKPAQNWQQYTSGVYTQPMTNTMLMR